ncbi:hypothetical protein HHI36_020679, partial [Cryptolaemus montrouzieri]
AFNSFFSEVESDLTIEARDRNNPHKTINQLSIIFHPTCDREIVTIMKSLKSNKVLCLDGIFSTALKWISDQI